VLLRTTNLTSLRILTKSARNNIQLLLLLATADLIISGSYHFGKMPPMLKFQRLISHRGQASLTSLGHRSYINYYIRNHSGRPKPSQPREEPESKKWKLWNADKAPGASKEEIGDLPVEINLETSVKCSPSASRETLFKSKHTLKDIQPYVGVIEILVQKYSEMSTKGPLSLLERMLKEF
jgi:hypothetical protein